MTPIETEEVTTASPDLYQSVARTVSSLQQDVLGNRGDRRQTSARAKLAELRRSAGATPDKYPIAWQTVLTTLDPPLSEREMGHGDSPSRSENAAFAALTLFALHMQSARTGMHVPKQSFARAVGLLVARSSSNSLQPRFNAMLVSRDATSRLHHARSLITLLRGEAIGFDYGHFARDLRGLSGAQLDGILLRWGRDFAQGARPQKQAEPSLDTTTQSPASSESN